MSFGYIRKKSSFSINRIYQKVDKKIWRRLYVSYETTINHLSKG